MTTRNPGVVRADQPWPGFETDPELTGARCLTCKHLLLKGKGEPLEAFRARVQRHAERHKDSP
jgi:hypothetical protein